MATLLVGHITAGSLEIITGHVALSAKGSNAHPRGGLWLVLAIVGRWGSVPPTRG